MNIQHIAPVDTKLPARYAGICGIISIASYFTVAFTELPDSLCFLGAMLFPAFGIGAVYFTKTFIARQQDSHANQLAFVFGLAAYITCAIFLSAQLAVQILVSPEHNRLPAELLPATKQAIRSIDMGIDVAWDIFIGSAIMLLAAGLWSIRSLRYWGVAGAVLAVLLLVLNIYTFPIPPADKGSIDMGPFIGIWLLAFNVRLLFISRKGIK